MSGFVAPCAVTVGVPSETLSEAAAGSAGCPVDRSCDELEEDVDEEVEVSEEEVGILDGGCGAGSGSAEECLGDVGV